MQGKLGWLLTTSKMKYITGLETDICLRKFFFYITKNRCAHIFLVLSRARVASLIKLIINVVISVPHNHCYPSDDVAPSFLLAVTHMLLHIHCHWCYHITPRRSPTIVSCNIFNVVQWRTFRLKWMVPLNTSQLDIDCSAAKEFLLDNIASNL